MNPQRFWFSVAILPVNSQSSLVLKEEICPPTHTHISCSWGMVFSPDNPGHNQLGRTNSILCEKAQISSSDWTSRMTPIFIATIHSSSQIYESLSSSSINKWVKHHASVLTMPEIFKYNRFHFLKNILYLKHNSSDFPIIGHKRHKDRLLPIGRLYQERA